MEACRRKGGSGANLPERGVRTRTTSPKATGIDLGARGPDRRWVA